MKKRYRNNGKNAGIYITIIFHLVVIITLLAYNIGKHLAREETFVMDLSQIEAAERELQEQIFREDIGKKIDDLLAASRNSQIELKNITVNAGSTLKDDRNTDVEQLMKDAERLKNELKQNQLSDMEDATDESVDLSEDKSQERKDVKKEEYSGPSLVSFTLDNRYLTKPSTPSYKCFGSGDVTVIIKVDRSGNVTEAKILDEVSSSDECIRKYAVRAARLTKFNASPTAPNRQTGDILYRFVSQ